MTGGMTPFYSDDWLALYGGDCREVLASLPSDSVDCVVTSPPYWGLRDYGTATWEGGDAECDHLRPVQPRNERPKGAFHGGTDEGDYKREPQYKDTCGKCGATRIDSQLGLERTPEEYVANMVEVFREVRRVLKPSGTCWLNLGSSYMSSGERTTGRNDAVRQGKQTGGGFEAGPRTRVGSRGSGPSRSRQPERAPAYDTDGTALAGSLLPGFAYPDLCDGCRADLSSHHRRSARSDDQPSGVLLPEPTARDSEPPDSELDAPDASPLDAQESTSPQSEQPPPGECSHCDNCGACLSVLRSVGRDARLCVRRLAYSGDTARLEPTSTDHTGDKESSGEAWGHYTSTLKPKDMVPIPWLVAMALQADGWYLRSDIIWAKPNPMPESVTDRPTKSHEYLFLLTKQPRYYFDADAVREPNTEYKVPDRPVDLDGRNKAVEGSGSYELNAGRGRAYYAAKRNPAGRNIRSVWTIATRPYPGAHFAVFPPELPERCIKAGSSEKGVCPECGAPWERDWEYTEKPRHTGQGPEGRAKQIERGQLGGVGGTTALKPASGSVGMATPKRINGWRPTCGHQAVIDDCGCKATGSHQEGCRLRPPAPEPAVILDPFGGSGTVGMVANRLSRRAILIDLNPEYLKQQMTRNSQVPLGLTEGDAA